MGSRLFRAATPSWQSAEIHAARAETLAELDAILAARGVDARLDGALAGIRRLEDEITADAALARFQYIIAALSHHARWGGLEETQVRQLLHLGEAILSAHGIDQTTSTLSFLWGELHVSNSQILRKDGRSWLATWRLHLAHYLSRRAPIGGPGFQALAIANRALRLGHLRIAEQGFRAARGGDLSQRNRELAAIGLVQALRMGPRRDEAESLIAALGADASLSSHARLELDWEVACCRAQADSDLEALVRATERRQEFRTASHFLEAFLWSRAVRSKSWLDRVPYVRNLRRLTGEDVAVSPAIRSLYAACTALERFGERERPMAQRIDALGETLPNVREFPSLTHELLFLAATARTLVRAKQITFATLVLADYRGRCLAMTDGASVDALRILGDIDYDRLTRALPEFAVKRSAA